jgi:hypothetical protein
MIMRRKIISDNNFQKKDKDDELGLFLSAITKSAQMLSDYCDGGIDDI